MKICMIAEGSYPYVYGGVSSWIDRLIRELSEHEFILYTIAPDESYKKKYKYDLPKNVTEIYEVFLEPVYEQVGKWGKRYRISSRQKEALKKMILGEKGINWVDLFTLFRSKRMKSALDFLMSKDFYDLLTEIGLQNYRESSFKDLFWNVRSLLLPLFHLTRNPIPMADLYHSVTTGYAGIIGSIAKLLYYKPFILTEHGIYSREREEEIIQSDWVQGQLKDLWINHFYTLSYCSYDLADQVITLFNGNKQIEMELGCPQNKIRIIPNGVNFHRFQHIPRKVLGDPKFIVGAFVRVVPIKDIKTMLQSFKIVQKEIPDSHFYIMGSYEENPEYYAECEAFVHTLQIQNVTFTGQIDVTQYIGKMDILVLTSISEGQPLSVLEGMAAGVPIVATDVGSCKELILGQDDGIGPAGMVTPIMNPVEIAKAIVSLAKDQEKRKQYGENGKLRVQQFYREDEVFRQYRQLYVQFKERPIWLA